LEPHQEIAASLIEETDTAVPAKTAEAAQPAELNEEVSIQQSSSPPWWDGTGREILSATRSWIQYGVVAFAVICIVIGAVEALFGR